MLAPGLGIKRGVRLTDRVDDLDRARDVVARHDHLLARGQGDGPRDVGRAEEELRPVVVEEGRVPATLVLAQHVQLALELDVRRERSRLADDLPPLHVLPLQRPASRENDILGVQRMPRKLAASCGPRGNSAGTGGPAQGFTSAADRRCPQPCPGRGTS